MERNAKDRQPDRPQPSLLDVDPVPFSLTARARRLVAPESLPPLELVTETPPVEVEAVEVEAVEVEAVEVEDADVEDDLGDPRRARARALRRAGTPVGTVARELSASIGQVERWTADVAPAAPAERREQVAARRQQTDLPVAFVSGRAAARAAWKRGTAVSSGAAMVAGLAEVTPFAVRLRGELAVVAGVLQWLRDAHGIGDTAVRASVEAAPGRACDQLANDVAGRLRLESSQVSARPWAQAPDSETIEVVVRISEPHLAGTIAGWREGLLAELVADPTLIAEIAEAG